MLYVKALTIPANTAASSPTQEELKLTDGVITRVEVEFPAGCAGLAHSYARLGVHQVFPTNPDGDLCSDDHVIAWSDYEDMGAEPRELVICGWNLDETYAHTVTWRIELTNRSIAERLGSADTLIERIARLLGIR